MPLTNNVVVAVARCDNPARVERADMVLSTNWQLRFRDFEDRIRAAFGSKSFFRLQPNKEAAMTGGL